MSCDHCRCTLSLAAFADLCRCCWPSCRRLILLPSPSTAAPVTRGTLYCGKVITAAPRAKSTKPRLIGRPGMLSSLAEPQELKGKTAPCADVGTVLISDQQSSHARAALQKPELESAGTDGRCIDTLGVFTNPPRCAQPSASSK